MLGYSNLSLPLPDSWVKGSFEQAPPTLHEQAAKVGLVAASSDSGHRKPLSRRPPSRMTAQLVNEVIRRYATGASSRDVAAVLGISKSTVLSTLDRAGVPKRPPFVYVRGTHVRLRPANDADRLGR